MIDQTNFMETLRSVEELTRTSNEPLSREEVMSYFSDMELTKEQQEMVYQYLLQPKEDNEPLEDMEEEKPLKEPEAQIEADAIEEKNRFFEMYQEDIKSLPMISKEEERQLYKSLSEGEEAAIRLLTDLWLPRVIAITDDYRDHQVNLEDLIQEGNLGLLDALTNLLGDRQVTQIEEYIKESIKKAMEDYIDENMEELDWESTVVAKATLIYEATEVLAKDLGRTPTQEELSMYTKLSHEEIQDIINLSKSNE